MHREDSLSLVFWNGREKKWMLTELPFPKGLTDSSRNSKASIAIKGNCWEERSRRRGQQLHDSEEKGRHTRKSRTFWRHVGGGGGDLVNGQKKKRKGQKHCIIYRSMEHLKKKQGNIQKSRLSLKVFSKLEREQNIQIRNSNRSFKRKFLINMRLQR